MLKITPSQMEHIEMAEFGYVVSKVQCRIRIMKQMIRNLKRLSIKAYRFRKTIKEETPMAKKGGKKKGGKKGGCK